MQPPMIERARAAKGSKATPRRFPFERSMGRPTNRLSTKGMFKAGSSGGFFHAAGADARRAHPYVFLHARHYRAHALQIRIPPPPPRVVGVADDVSIGRCFAAEFTLHCHSIVLLGLNLKPGKNRAFGVAKPSSSF